jgi:hypothetical protein
MTPRTRQRDTLQRSYTNFQRDLSKPDSVDAFDDSIKALGQFFEH